MAATVLGGLDRDALAEALRPLWEDAGPLVDRLVGRSVDTWEEHIAEATAEITALDDRSRMELLRAHQRIGADPVVLARRSALSYREQGGGAARSPAVSADLAALNDRYEERFSFPFVEWVAGRPPGAIIEVIETRLTHDRRTELDAGCSALIAIAGDRLSYLRRARP